MRGHTIDQLVADMTLSEKVGQMTQASNDAVTPAEVADFAIGSVLSGGNGNPDPNSPKTWVDMVGGFADAASDTRFGVPVLYGVDAVHGHSNVRGATVFPHNIGLGAVDDDRLMRRIGKATALEMSATGVNWTFAPAVAVARDIRWGRTYESYGRDPALVTRLSGALIEGLTSHNSAGSRVVACAKHFVGDGASTWGSVNRKPWMKWWEGWGDAWQIDQGDAVVTERELRNTDLPPYERAIAAGAMSVMASYSSWNGTKMHAHRALLTDTLKDELGFRGFVVSDWMGVDQISEDYEESVVRAVNAGIDMVMVPLDWRRFIDVMHRAVADGRIPIARVDDAVRRILQAKAWLDERDPGVRPSLDVVGAEDHRHLAATAARRSAVLIKNERGLPLTGSPDILLGGQAAHDVGLQCGGWTVGWQGAAGPVTPGTTLLDALEMRFPGSVTYQADGTGDSLSGYDVGIACVAEEPYAEGPGDRLVPTVREEDRAAFDRIRRTCRTVVLIVYSGRPLVIPDLIARSDAVVAAWLPGTEATQLPDLLVGESEFEGRLPQPWPAAEADLAPSSGANAFPSGHGLRLAPEGVAT